MVAKYHPLPLVWDLAKTKKKLLAGKIIITETTMTSAGGIHPFEQ